jgi:hypothetical protein
MPLREITTEEIKTYQDDGIVCLRGLFSSEWVEALRQAAEDSMQNPGELHAELAETRKEKGRFFHDTFVWKRNEVCRNYVFNSPAARIAGAIMESSKVNIFFDQWLIKEPGTVQNSLASRFAVLDDCGLASQHTLVCVG